ncbi:keratin-associated protein 19-4-like [Argopecten irradians]|uniref:keratin-associated protein 19-4-like n=1 Tax=Argopecten irradians TaxID=31199 RepID=UPI003719417E
MMKVMFLFSCLVAGALCHYYDNNYYGPTGFGSNFESGFGGGVGFSGYDAYEPGYGNNFYGRGQGGFGSFGSGYGNNWMRQRPVTGGY